jgi:hypothetical protein
VAALAFVLDGDNLAGVQVVGDVVVFRPGAGMAEKQRLLAVVDECFLFNFKFLSAI